MNQAALVARIVDEHFFQFDERYTVVEAPSESQRLESIERFTQTGALVQHSVKDGFATVPQDGPDTDQGLGFPLGDHREIEDVAASEQRPSVPHLLGNDLRRRLDTNLAAQQGLDHVGFSAEWSRSHKVDLPLVEPKLEREMVLDVVRRQRLCLLVETRRQVSEPLRIRHEDIDILADAMMVAKHEHGPAPESPIDGCCVGFESIEKVEGPSEENTPSIQSIVVQRAALSEGILSRFTTRSTFAATRPRELTPPICWRSP